MTPCKALWLSLLIGMIWMDIGSPFYLSFRAINHRDLVVQCPEVINIANPKDPKGAQVDNPGKPLSHIHAVYPEKSKEGQQYPGSIIIDLALPEPQAGFTFHRWDQKEIHEPPNEQEPKSEEVNRSRDGLAIVEPPEARPPAILSSDFFSSKITLTDKNSSDEYDTT